MTLNESMKMIAMPLEMFREIVRDAFINGVDWPDLSTEPETQKEADAYAQRMIDEHPKPAPSADPCGGFKEQRDQWADGALNAESAFTHEQRVSEFMFLANNAILIPAGTKARKCTGAHCNAMIYDVPPVKEGGKFRPVSIAKYGNNPIGIPPTDTADGAGISHFADCPDAPTFHRGKR